MGGYLRPSVSPPRSPCQPGCPGCSWRSSLLAGLGQSEGLPCPCLSPGPLPATQTHATSGHENLQQIPKADDFFSPPVVTCMGRLWIRPVSASLLIKSPNFFTAQLCAAWLPWGKKATRRSEPLQ